MFVNSAIGSDSNGCAGAQQPTTPLRTLAAGIQCIVQNAKAGDQVMVAEGTRYAEPISNLTFRDGYSAQYPTVIQSYDPADPFNEAKHGRATGSKRPVFAVSGDNAVTILGSNYAIRGLDLDGASQPDVVESFVGGNNNVLLENNIFRAVDVTFDKGSGSQASHQVMRKNAFYGTWSPTSHAQGLYVGGTDALTVEDNVFWHNGWKVGVTRDTDVTLGGPTTFRHALYAQIDTSSLVRRNTFIDPSLTGCSCRGDTSIQENVFIDNPGAIGAGMGPNYNVYRPNGVAIDIGYNLVLGDADLNSSLPFGQAIASGNGKPGSSAHNNLILLSRNMTGMNVATLNNQSQYDQPSYLDFTNNLVYHYSAVMAVNGGIYPAQTITTYNNNRWDAPASGTNTNSAGITFSNPLTSAGLYTALGCGTKDQCVQLMINSPEAGWAAKIRSIMWAGYNM